MSLFSSSSSRTQSKNLVEFRAGKMTIRGNMIHPDKRKGLVYIHQSSDSLINFCWKDRQSGSVEDDWIISPDECEYVPVPQCTTGRVFLLKFKSSKMKLFFWMQEPKTDQDETYCQKVNEYLNNPPTSGSQQDLQSLLSSMSQQQLMQLFGNVGEMSGLSSLLFPFDRGSSSPSRSSVATSDSVPQVRSAAAIPPATTPSFANVGSNLPATPLTTGVPSLGNFKNLQQILSGIKVSHSPTGRPEKPSVDLSKGLSVDVLHLILNNADLVRRLRDFLPPSDQASDGVTASMFRDTVQSPQLAQSLIATAELEPASDGDANRTQSKLEEILLSPSFPSVDPVVQVMWVHEEDIGLTQREITFVPALYKIFDEILVNSADNKIRDNSMDTLRVDIDPATNIIKIFYNGEGIPVVEHAEEKMYVPSLIFCHFLPSFNVNDGEEEVTGGRNCYGHKLCNIFSTSFQLEIASKDRGKTFKQKWTANMTEVGTPQIHSYSGPSYTEITFSLDLGKLKVDHLDSDILGIFSRRVYDIAATTRGVKVYLNGNLLPISSFKDYVDLFLEGEQDCLGGQLKCVHEAINDCWEIAVASSSEGFKQVSFLNKFATRRGRHVAHVADLVTQHFANFLRGYQVTLNSKTIEKHIWIFVNCSMMNTENMSQCLQQCTPSRRFFMKLNDCGVTERLMLLARMLGIYFRSTVFAIFYSCCRTSCTWKNSERTIS